jgi:hypothetical protein
LFRLREDSVYCAKLFSSSNQWWLLQGFLLGRGNYPMKG